MQELYEKSLRVIKLLNIKTKEEYNKLLKDYLLLNIESLKYVTGTRNFKEIVKYAEEA